MSSVNVVAFPETNETRWISMQLAFSTADLERTVFHAEVGAPQGTPNVHNLAEADQVAVVVAGDQPSLLPIVRRVAVVHGQFLEIEDATPPRSIPLDAAAGLLRLAED